jgi:O-antigen ligase
MECSTIDQPSTSSSPSDWRLRTCLAAMLVLIATAGSGLFMDSYTKVKWVVLGIGTLALIVFLPGASTLVPARTRGWALPASLLATYLARIALDSSPASLEAVLAFLTLAVTAVSARAALAAREEEPAELVGANLLALAAVCLVGWLQFAGFDPLISLGAGELPASTFGFQNMTAEFVGFSALFAAVYARAPGGRWRRTALLVLPPAIAYLGVLRSRAVIVGLAAAAIALLAGLAGSLKGAGRRAWVALLLVAVSAAALWSIQSDAPLGRIKAQNSQVRLIRWRNTWEMIREHPLGVGFGNFPFAYLSYRSRTAPDRESTESLIVKSPHNAYLGLAAEGGLALLAATLALALYSIFRALSALASATLGPERRRRLSFYVAGCVFFGVDSLFNFPLELAFTCFAMALTIGFGWSALSAESRPVSARRQALLLALPFLAIACLTLGYAYSEYVYANGMEDPQALARSCALFPANSFVCAREAELALHDGDPERAAALASRVLERHPNQFFALKVRADAQLALGRRDLACHDYQRYLSLFGRASAEWVELQRACTAAGPAAGA